MVSFYQYLLPVRPIKQTVRHSQGDHVLEFRLLRIGAKIQNFTAIQGDGYYGVLNMMGNQ